VLARQDRVAAAAHGVPTRVDGKNRADKGEGTPGARGGFGG
jgi:hypothetical protein